MKNWRRYPEYQDSGVEWLGEIPQHWEVKKIKYILRLSYGDSLSSDIREDGDIPVYGSNGIIGNHTSSNTLAPCIIVGRKGSYGKITYSENYSFAIDTTYFIDHRRTKANIILRWLFYALSLLELDKSSQDTGVPGLSREFTHNKLLPLPPSIEQKAIAHFLDRETSKLDNLIAKKERFIELLQEKRTALISHAVTKGLNPDVPMKDSGVEWLGQIPQHWEVKKLKNLCSLLRDGTHTPPSRVTKGIPLLSVRNIVNGKFINLDDDSLISEEDFLVLERSFKVKTNDILLAIVGATLGKVAIVENMPSFSIQRSLAVLRPKANFINYKFFYFSLASDGFHNILWKNVVFSAQPGIYLGSLGNFKITFPDIEEQKNIINYLDHETAKIDSLIEKIKTSIEKLKEYRTALISAAVTGKIDVREEVV